ncbi:hypothetical protein RHSIM_Rhsim09G0079700 [Rhododendron simsii]|uniref:RNase H type-1 domain-containing protein n=1 Tax=Rhododendron simsii TaxID=118357 RepID=A0A834GFE3_RHOSS|nr:hypothetical protein RHSIM_Rhsim09G0079700 [Rhododendron simsii]
MWLDRLFLGSVLPSLFCSPDGLSSKLAKPEELPKEEPKPWVLQVDGSTTREANRASLILTSPKGQRLSYALRFEFKTTNNEAEYEALVLVVGQVLGEYTVKEEVLQKYLDKVKAQVAKLQSFNIVRIPREENNEADYLARLATAKEDAIPRNTPTRYLELPSIFSPDIQVQAINYSDSWTGPIVDYITNGPLPDDKVKARQLKIRAAKYLMMGDVLYRRSFSLPYLKCLTTKESTQAMDEVHQVGRMIAYKLLRLAYYWSNMQKDYNSMGIDHQGNQEDLRAKLDLLEETRETAMAKVAVYQQRMVKYHEA